MPSGQCKPLPPGFFPTPPALPGGIGLPTFTPPVISNTFCCSYQVPPWGAFPLPLPPLVSPVILQAITAFIAGVEDGIALAFDAVAIPCPTQ